MATSEPAASADPSAEAPSGDAAAASASAEDEFSSFTWQSGEYLFAQAKIEEVRPGRQLCVLHKPPSSPSLPTLFLVHGSCASFSQYVPLAAALSERRGYGIVAWDWLGCGRSSKPDNWSAYHPDELYADMAAVWQKYCTRQGEEFVVAKQTYIVAHSFGCHLAMRLALLLQSSEDTSMAGLVLLSSALQLPEGHPIFRLPVFLLNRLQPSMTEAFVSVAFTENANADLLRKERDGCNRNPMYMCKAYYRQIRNLPESEIRKVRAHTLVVHGTSDGIVRKEGVQALVAALPGAVAEVATVEASHNLMLECPDVVARIVANFVSKHLSTSCS
eukprot:gnl/TRDRNA2_/TRDRNA2_57169_c0_seq1.p1 gnl/TRDRNA2_/TRDRNA2_57169_c0~~gnl/TRDRNA2_/TRDRNA2_57169_c0_seq1.p1  ORF type:complete len:331 (+),score=43.19 gnl/TRDRNA2_/TRDRNA2_57169_c0_seq1:49-1041(+)